MRSLHLLLVLAISCLMAGVASAQVWTGPQQGGGGNDLTDLIGSTVQPSSWDTVGGPGSMAPFDSNLSLVVSQTQETHEEIVDLLEQLRRLQDLQVTVEVPFNTVSDSFFEKMGVGDWSGHIKGIPFSIGGGSLATPQFGGYDPSAGMRTGFAMGNPGNGAIQPLNDTDGGRSRKVGMAPGGLAYAPKKGWGLSFPNIQAAQGYRQTAVTQAPVVTLFNGQRAYVSDTSQSPFVISQIPVVGNCPILPVPTGFIYNPNRPRLPVLATTERKNHRVAEMMRRKMAEQNKQKGTPGDNAYFRHVQDPSIPQRIPVKAEKMPVRKAGGQIDRRPAGGLDMRGPAPAANTVPGRSFASTQKSSAGRAVPSVAEARRMHEAEQAKGNDEARIKFEQGLAAEERGKPGLARVYYSMAAKRATGELRTEILGRLKALGPRETRERE